jgi:hypothetical protein
MNQMIIRTANKSAKLMDTNMNQNQPPVNQPNPSLNDHTAKLLMYHVHKIGLALSAFETELQGTHACNDIVKIDLRVVRKCMELIQQEIIDLRDGKS